MVRRERTRNTAAYPAIQSGPKSICGHQPISRNADSCQTVARYSCLMSRYRFPDGVSYERHGHDGSPVLRVAIPVDDDGFFGRQCPVCGQRFRISDGVYDALPDDVRLWCVYCGHVEDHSEFLTDQQDERVIGVAGDYAEQLIGSALDDMFRRAARRSKGTISYRSRPLYPSPLPDIDEESLVRQRACPSCSIRYAVFGEHRFCPSCGPLPPVLVAQDALGAEITRLDALNELPADTLALLRGKGSWTVPSSTRSRIWSESWKRLRRQSFESRFLRPTKC